ncbi:MAG: hypothetical protein LBR31_03445 [Desulfovibrio sp.]|nr:hypothetical protein [Desulfovibrio sp.]
MLIPFTRLFFLPALLALSLAGCSSYQPTKDVWKSTKDAWNTYISPAAEIDYSEKGSLSPSALELSKGMMAVDEQLRRLERAMMNADKPPTKSWVAAFMSDFPWLSGFAGVKYDGVILGQTPAPPQKQLDFIPLLYEDKKQSNRALRACVQNNVLGPEVMLAVPLYDGADFLGVLVAYFDMRTLVQFCGAPSGIVILAPQALLWPGKYEYGATPLSGTDWKEVVTKSSSGECKNAAGSFYYIVRWFANLPLVFSVCQSGSFPDGDGNPDQGLRYFPQEAEKLPPPPRPERKSRKNIDDGQQMTPTAAANIEGSPAQPASGAPAHDIQPGSSESVLLKGKAGTNSRVRERRLEGEDVPVERTQRPRRVQETAAPARKTQPETPDPESATPISGPRLPDGRPSPFGPPGEKTTPQAEEKETFGASRTTDGETNDNDADKPSEPKQPDTQQAPTLPGGRPSPFGPR